MNNRGNIRGIFPNNRNNRHYFLRKKIKILKMNNQENIRGIIPNNRENRDYFFRKNIKI